MKNIVSKLIKLVKSYTYFGIKQCSSKKFSSVISSSNLTHVIIFLLVSMLMRGRLIINAL